MSDQLKEQNDFGALQTDDVKDGLLNEMLLAEQGREAITRAESLMSGLMECRRRYGLLQPLLGARIAGGLDLDANTAVLVETLIVLGAQVQWTTSGQNWYMELDPTVVSALKLKGVSFYSFDAGTVSTVSVPSVSSVLEFPFGKKPNLLYDLDGELTHAMCKMSLGNEIDGIVEMTLNDLEKDLRQGARCVQEPNQLKKLQIISFTELLEKSKVTRCNYNRCEKSLVQYVKEFTDKIPAPDNVCIVVGYRGWSKSCARALRYAGITVVITECDPVFALEAERDGFKRVTLEQAYQLAMVFVIGTKHPKIDLENLNKMKVGSLVCTISCCSSEKAKEVKGYDGYLADFMLPNEKHVQILEYHKNCDRDPLTKSYEYTLHLLAVMELWEKRMRGAEAKVNPYHIVSQAALLHLPGLDAGQDGNLSNILSNDLIIYKYPKNIRITKIPHFSALMCADQF